MFGHLEEQLLNLIDILPLEVFVLVASFVEEIVAPIPSPTVMVLSGSFASVQEYTYGGLILLAIIGAVGKTLGAFFVYHIADKLEDVFIVRFGKFFSITQEDIATFGARLTGKPRDYVLLTVFRAMPFIPSVVVSVGGGVLKIPMRMFLVTTFLGTIIRDGLYLYAGYVGTAMLARFIRTADHLESYVTIGAVLTVAGVALWLYRRAHTTSSPTP